jgi:peroxiredoxin
MDIHRLITFIKSKYTLLTFIASICIIISALVIREAKRASTSVSKAELKVENVFPSFIFKELDGGILNSLDMGGQKSIMIVLFNTTCDYCHDKMTKLIEYSSEFDHSQILFISSESIEDISKFRDQYKSEKLNIKFLHASFEEIQDSFPAKTIPAIWIYNRKKMLVKKIDDIVPMKIIVKYIRAANDQ